MQTMPALDGAVAAWRALLGSAHVILETQALRDAETATYPTDGRVTAIIRPASTTEVAECMRIAQEHGTPVYPISTGKNWGYGSRVPPSPQAAILDLSRMNAILDFSEEMGTVTVQPGVTFAQLEHFLEEKQSKRFMAAPGTTPNASVIGNAVERGWGFGPYSDRFEYACGMEVVLPDGEVVDTGFERFAGSKAAHSFKWGVGPWFDGMFTQSNLGIVTRMTIFLAPTPPHFVTFVYRFADSDRLPGLMDTLRELKMRGIIRTNFKVQSFYRLLMERQQFPSDQGNGALLPPEMAESLKKKWGIDVWNGFGALYCWSEKQKEAEIELVTEALSGQVDHLLFLDDEKNRNRDQYREAVRAETGFDLDLCLDRFWVNTRLRGVDKGKGVTGGYWRKKEKPPAEMDLDLDKVGFIWVDPVLPFHGREVKDAADLIGSIMLRHGFEPNLGFNCVTERSIFMTVALVYDRDVPGDDERAMACARDITSHAMEGGFTLGRLSTDNMQSVLERAQPSSMRMQARIRAALDPAGILAPGRYELLDERS